MPLTAAQLAQLKADDAALTADLAQLTEFVTNPANKARVATAVTAAGKVSADIAGLVADPPALSVTTTSLPSGTVGVAYSAQLAATGGTAPYTWSSAGLPAGLSLSASGAITGTPTAAGSTPVSVKVTDSSTPQLSVSAQLNLVVAVAPPPPPPPPNPPSITTMTLPDGTVGVPYSVQLEATGGVTPYKWSLSTGGLPAGLTLSPAGLLAGTPTTAEVGLIIVACADSETPPQDATPMSLQYDIQAATTPPTIPPSVQKVVLHSTVYLGNHYAPNVSITMQSMNAGNNQTQTPVAIGATEWWVLDSKFDIVGTGTCAATAESIVVASNGTWVGGSAVLNGSYTVVTANGTGSVYVSPPTRLPVPTGKAQGTSVLGGMPIDFGVWFGSPDRDFYSVQSPGLTPAQITANLAADPFFSGPQDPARPHHIWVAPDPQSSPSSESPTPANWGALASAMVAAGHAGASYELPTNEPENGGWSVTGNLITYWQACATAVLAADPTAKCMGFDSGGIYNNTEIPALATFLAAVKGQIAGFTNHMENSNQNASNLLALRQYFGGIKAEFVAAGLPELTYWNTETGIDGGLYGVLHPRRDMRQRTMIRFVAESFGWPHEQQYDFPHFDHHGSGLGTYMVDCDNGQQNGCIRAGAFAVHIMHEALYGTTCTPASPPAALSFGPAGSAGDSMFMGLHYSGTENDVVVLATNGMESGSVVLDVSATGSVTCWDGEGRPSALTVTNGQIIVPVDDLLAYVFLPTGSTVSVAPAPTNWWMGTTNVIAGHAFTDGAGASTSLLTDGNFGKNNSGITGVVGPYKDTTVPDTLTDTVTTTEAAVGFALLALQAWQGSGCSPTSFDVLVNGEVAWSYRCASAVTQQIPSPSNGNSSDAAPYTTWWTAPFGFLVPLAIPAGSKVGLRVNATGYGGQPDLLGSTSPLNSYHEGDSQEIQLAQLQLLS